VLNTELRPLGAGELLDRAVTIFVRHFVPIVVVLAVAIVPLLAVEALASPHPARMFSDLARVFTTSADQAAQREAIKALSAGNTGNGWLAALYFVAVLVRLLMWSAIVALITSAYAGSPTTVAQAYRVGLQRWLPQVVVALAFAVVGIVALIPLMIAYVLVILLVVMLAALQLTVATVIGGVIGGLAVLAAFVIVGSWVFMAYELAAVAVVTETANPFTAVGTAMRRGLASGMRRRMIVGGLVIFLVSEGGALPLIGVAVVATTLTHLDALYFAILGAGSVLLEGLVAAFVVVYAVDVRVRREGIDLVAEPPPAVA
jgi:hypothetical protein